MKCFLFHNVGNKTQNVLIHNVEGKCLVFCFSHEDGAAGSQEESGSSKKYHQKIWKNIDGTYIIK